jgi:hypothetical protein
VAHVAHGIAQHRFRIGQVRARIETLALAREQLSNAARLKASTSSSPICAEPALRVAGSFMLIRATPSSSE